MHAVLLFGMTITSASADWRSSPRFADAVLAALTTTRPVAGRRCVDANVKPVTSEMTNEVLQNLSLNWAAKSLTGARDAIQSLATGAAKLPPDTRRHLQRHGWTVLDRSTKRSRAGCALFATIAGPALTHSYGLAEISYVLTTEGRLYVQPVLVRRADFGWEVAAVGSSYIVVI